MEKAKEKPKKTGFGLRLSFAIILTVFAAVCALLGSGRSGGGVIRLIFMFTAIIFIAATVLQYVATFAGKKHIWANTVSIVVGIVFTVICGLGVLAIIGGVRGRRILVATKAEVNANAQAEEEQAKLLAEKTVPEDSDIEIQAITVSKEAEIPEYIQSKISAKGKRGIMIALIVSYSLLLLVGVLLSAIPAAGKIISGMGICEAQNSRAYGLAIGVMWVALVPAIGYYFAMLSPFKVSKKVRATIAVLTTVLLVAMIAVFFIVINCVKLPVGEEKFAVKKFFEGSDSWFIPVSAAFASLGIALCYLTLLFRIKTENGKSDRGALKVVKGVLRAKEKYPDAFILAASVLLTWLAHFVAFVISIIVIVIFIGIIAMFFLKVLSIDSGVSRAIDVATGGDGNYGKKKYSFTNDMGCEQTVYSADGKTFYNADGSYAGKSNDGGRHIEI